MSSNSEDVASITPQVTLVKTLPTQPKMSCAAQSILEPDVVECLQMAPMSHEELIQNLVLRGHMKVNETLLQNILKEVAKQRVFAPKRIKYILRTCTPPMGVVPKRRNHDQEWETAFEK